MLEVTQSITALPLDTSLVIVTLITTIGGIVVAIVQYGKRKEEESGKKTAQKTARQASVSEAAMASVAERSLTLLESLLKAEKEENTTLNRLLSETHDRLASSNDTIEELRREVARKDSMIRELEYELHRLRGHLDSLLVDNKGLKQEVKDAKS